MIRNPCWECIKGRHLNCDGLAEEREELRCDCPHPADDTEQVPLDWDAEREVYTLDTP